eukprot:gene25885-31679_t
MLPFEDLLGKEVTLFGVADPRYHNKRAFVANYDESAERCVLWLFNGATSIKVRPGAFDCVDKGYLDVPPPGATATSLWSDCLAFSHFLVDSVRCSCTSCLSAPGLGQSKGTFILSAISSGEWRRAVDAYEKERHTRPEAVIDFLHLCDDVVDGAREFAFTSTIAAHRALAQKAFCFLRPILNELKKNWEGCAELRAAAASFMRKVDDARIAVFGDNPAARDETVISRIFEQSSGIEPSLEAAAISHEGPLELPEVSSLEEVNGKNLEYTLAVSKLVAAHLEAAWCTVKHRELWWEGVLLGFSNITGVLDEPETASKLTDFLKRKPIVEWACLRLLFLQKALGSEEHSTLPCAEVLHLLSLLYNACRHSDVIVSRVMRLWGPEFFHREANGSPSAAVRQSAAHLLGILVESDEIMALRPCTAALEMNTHFAKETRPGEFE